MSNGTAYTINEVLEDNRNVTDQFKGMDEDVIIGEQNSRRIPLITVLTNLTTDFNKATILRTHSGVAGKGIFFLNKPNNQQIGNPEGTKHYNRTGTVGTHRYNTVTHYDINRYRELFTQFRQDGYTIVAVDNVEGYDAKIVYDVDLPEKTVFILGEEKYGIPTEIIEEADVMVYLPMNGVSPRSYNVGVSHGMVVNEYLRQNRQLVRD